MSRFYFLLMMEYIWSSLCLTQASTNLETKQLSLIGSNLGLDQRYQSIMTQSLSSDIYMKLHRAQSDEEFDLVFGMQRGNIEEVPRIQRQILNPMVSGLALCLLRENVESACNDLESRSAAVSYLILNGVTITSDWQNGEYLTAKAPMITWEKMFQCEFYTFLQNYGYGNDVRVTRTEKYYIPKELNEQVTSVYSIVRELPNTPSVIIGGLRIFISPIIMEIDQLTDRRESPAAAPIRSVFGDKEDSTKSPVSKPVTDDEEGSTKSPVSKPVTDGNEGSTKSPSVSPSIERNAHPSRSPEWHKKKVPKYSATPSPPIYVYAMITQSLSGVTSDQALNSSFSIALMDALSSEIGYLINVNSVVQILKRRILLANIDIAYSVSTDSLQATEGWISRLQLSAASPDFTLLLRNASGYPDITILSTNIVNIAPTGSPTLSPLSTAADTATLILAVGGALVGALVIGVSVCIIYCCCFRVNKYSNTATLPEMPDAHPPMAVAVLAQSSSLSNPTSTHSMTGYPVALPTPVTRGLVQNVYVLQDVENHDPTLPLYHTTQA